ncbi:hypothetical protein B4U80_01315 [Leptotrombidium deliense]|uniref:TIL domain-containing protein n=1 Tax=Leptotrombidium deliense TaxID=299467 RepID=A0A443RX21_9ACAR|nr:hypothetical protein B4U80_01315 [Leptotrombidium deliense]
MLMGKKWFYINIWLLCRLPMRNQVSSMLIIKLITFFCEYSVPKCGKNEAYIRCGGCERTCENYKQDAIKCHAACIPSCTCITGFVRTPQGTCDIPGRCNPNARMAKH